MKKRGHRITEHLLLGLFHGFIKAFQKNKVLSRDFKQSTEMAFCIFIKRKRHKVGKVRRLYKPRVLVFDVNIRPIMQKCKIRLKFSVKNALRLLQNSEIKIIEIKMIHICNIF